MDWAGDNPYFLVVSRRFKRRRKPVIEIIDVDVPGWHKRHRALIRYRPATWHLARKKTSVPPVVDIVFTMLVLPGEDITFIVRHVGKANRDMNKEVQAYGLTKTRRDGHRDRLWVLPNDQICGGDDVDPLALQLVR